MERILFLVSAVVCAQAFNPFFLSHHKPQSSFAQSAARQDFHFVCPQGQAINRFKSTFGHCDRQWGFDCAQVDGVTPFCFWTDFQNGAQNPDYIHSQFDFECPSGGAITGVETKFFDHLNDRQYRFKCCATAVTKSMQRHFRPARYTNCKEFNLNRLRDPGDVRIPKGFVCTTWRADRYLPPREDRTHSVRCCRLSFCKRCRPFTGRGGEPGDGDGEGNADGQVEAAR